MLDKTRPFTIVNGSPGVRYIQDGRRFNCGGYPAKELPPVAVEEPTPEMCACEWCGKEFKNAQGLRMHMMRVHPDDVS